MWLVTSFWSIWMQGPTISLQKWLQMYQALCVSTIMYNCSSSWAAQTTILNIIYACHRFHLHCILGIRWPHSTYFNEVIEAHCYVVRYRQIDCKQRGSKKQSRTDCRTLQPHRPLSAAYKTVLSSCNLLLIVFCYVFDHNLFACISNEALYKWCNTRPLSVMAAETRWNMLGHVLHMDWNAPAQDTLQYAVEGAKHTAAAVDVSQLTA